MDKILVEPIDFNTQVPDLGMVFKETSIEGFVDKKLDYFFTRLGNQETEGLYEAVIDQVEKSLISKALNWAEGNQIKASRVLGINRNTLRTKMRRLKIKGKS